jgi:hypothetical protein
MSTEIIVSLIASLFGGVIVAIIGLLFTRSKTKAETNKIIVETKRLLEEAKSLQNKRAIELEEAKSVVEVNQAQAEKLREESAQLRKESEINTEVAQELSESTKELRQVTSYKNFKSAFLEMEEYIRNYLKESYEKGTTSSTVRLKLIAVAMTFSWEFFIATEIPSILHDFPNAQIELDILFLDHKFLETQNIGRLDIDWKKKCKDRLSDVNEFAKQCSLYNGRLKFQAKVYQNLPHWHGWLVNGDHLFLGRCDWLYGNELPVLRVGQNKYRHFDTSNSESTELINLFGNWQRYYFEFASEWVCDSSNTSPGDK